MTVQKATEKLEKGEINGFRIGNILIAKNNCHVQSDSKGKYGEVRILQKGAKVRGLTFSKYSFGFRFNRKKFKGKISDFVIEKEFVYSVW